MLTLRYFLNRTKMGNDTVALVYDDVALFDTGEAGSENMYAALSCPGGVVVSAGDRVSATLSHVLYDEVTENYTVDTETAEYTVSSVDAAANSFTVTVPKYRWLECGYADMETDEDGAVYLRFGFDTPHLLDPQTDDGEGAPNPNSFMYVHFGGVSYVWATYLETPDSYTVRWRLDQSAYNAEGLLAAIFPEWDGSVPEVGSRVYGDTSAVTVRRVQTMWRDSVSDPGRENPELTVEKPSISVSVPIQESQDVRLGRDDAVRNGFVTRRVAESINAGTDMERTVYKPAFIDDRGVFGLARTLNFNLHFRTHSGDDWLVENGDTWNFAAHGSGAEGQNYYSFADRSNQADLLGYAGFSDSDVKYQKNRLKKSFLRLAFYDSDIPGRQNLLAYSVVHIDSGRLYSRYMNSASADIYRNLEGDILTGARVSREVDEDRLMDRLGVSAGLSDDTVEEYRLSSRLSVSDPSFSDGNCEGFNLFLWADGDESPVPSDIYMKAEFNHAGYGRVVPMMAPFRDGGSVGFKTNGEIAADWSSAQTQYGPSVYNRYSYIKLKCVYDKPNRRHVYYLDPDRYGTVGFGETININLYEARVAFND